MDPITQSLLGAVAVQATMTGRLGRAAVVIGAIAGEMADADVLLGSLADPAAPFALHRHFTHALAFIPVGAAVAAAPLLALRRFRAQAKATYGAAAIGYATHGLLDNCTSYGTHLLWPFVTGRTAWDAMSIVDPIFTGILFVAVLAALLRGRAGPARVGLALGLLYIGFGFVQHERARAVQTHLAAERGHVVVRSRVMPSLGNVIVWRSVYEHDGRLYADAVRVPPLGAPLVKTGISVPRVAIADLTVTGPQAMRMREVLREWDDFSAGFLAVPPARAGRSVGAGPGILQLGDMRYSYQIEAFAPIWGVELIRSGEGVRDAEAASFSPPDGVGIRRLLDEWLHGGARYLPIAELDGRPRGPAGGR